MLIAQALLVIIAELNVVHVAVLEAEANPPLVVHGDGVLPGAGSLQRVQSITRRYAQIRKLDGDVNRFELPQSTPGHVQRNSLRSTSPKQFLGPPIGKGFDHVGV
jgi:hypothetical protein